MSNTIVVNEEAVVLDTAMSKGLTSGIYVGGAGDISFVDSTGNTQTRVGLLAGAEYNLSATKINTTGTTATDLKALYTQ